MTDQSDDVPTHEAMRSAVQGIRHQLAEVEKTLRWGGYLGDTAQAIIGLSPPLTALGAALMRWENDARRRSL